MVWNDVVRRQELPEYLCANCIIRVFVLAGRSFTAVLSSADLDLVPIEVTVNGQAALDAELVQQENNELRRQIVSADPPAAPGGEMEPQYPASGSGGPYRALIQRAEQAEADLVTARRQLHESGEVDELHERLCSMLAKRNVPRGGTLADRYKEVIARWDKAEAELAALHINVKAIEAHRDWLLKESSYNREKGQTDVANAQKEAADGLTEALQ